MATETQTAVVVSPDLIEQIVKLLARPPQVPGIEFDQAYYAHPPEAGTRSVSGSMSGNMSGRRLLPSVLNWRSQDPATAETRVPLQLCEFLAYKTALAYETAERIENYLKDCCTGYTRVKFFDSTVGDNATYGALADAQAYGFVFEGKAFVIFRGTSSGIDWKINRMDALTDDVLVRKDKRYLPLRKTYGPLLDMLGDPEPGRHIGFSIAWAAIKEDVEDWLAEIFEAGEADQIIYSGHSLGGAMAQIAAFDHARIGDAIGKDKQIRIDHVAAVVTFGAPAVGSREMAEVYKRLLGDRTVLLESSGDLVPRIMNRWYYRMLYPLRQRIKAGVQLHLQENDAFGKVATPWSFVHEPPLANSEIDSALRALANAAKEIAEKEAKKKKEAEEKAEKAPKDAERKATAANRDADAGKPGSTASSSATRPATTSETTQGSQPSSQPGNAKGDEQATIAYWIVVGVVALAVTGVVWYFVRRKLFSHDIEQRYALYLSTLSYQQLRAKHGGDLKLANAELDEHLQFVRGDLKKGIELAKKVLDAESKPKPFFESVHGLPVTLELRNDPHFVKFLQQQDTFV